MRYIALILMLIAPSWATANERNFICTAKAAIGWKEGSLFDSVGRVKVENQWLLSAIDEKEFQFSDPQKKPLQANYSIKLLGKDDPEGYCRNFSSEDIDYVVANCFFLSELNDYKGTLSEQNTFWMENLDGPIIFRMIKVSEFQKAFLFPEYVRQTTVAYEQGSCKSF